MIKAIIFDADGVIIDTENAYNQADGEFFGSLGVTDTPDKYKQFISGMGLTNGIAAMSSIYGFNGTPSELTEKRIAVIKRHYKNIKFIPGFLKFFSKIKNSYRTAVATSSNEELFEIADAYLGLRKLFGNSIYFLKAVKGISKPAPDIYLYAAKQINFCPAECLAIEDSPNGIKSAKAAGMKCIGLTTTHPASLLTDADEILPGFEQIKFPL